MSELYLLRRAIVCCVSCLALLLAPPALALELKVDIGVADAPPNVGTSVDEVQSGFSAFSVVPDFDVDFGNYGPAGKTQVISGVTIAIAGQDNGPLFFDDRGEITHALGDLLEDGVDAAAAELFVTLTNLPAGLYQVTTYHHRGALRSAGNPFDIYLNNGSGEALAAADIIASVGAAPATISTATFPLTATGSPVIIRFEGGPPFENPISPVLNGFTIVPVPEPSTWMLAASAALVLGLRARKRRA
jgi:hypothetical protein